MILSARGCDTDTGAVTPCAPQNPPRNWLLLVLVLWLCCCADVIWLLPPSACSSHIPRRGLHCTRRCCCAPQTSQCFSGAAAASLQQELLGFCLGWARGHRGAGGQPSPSHGLLKDRGSRALAPVGRKDSSLTGGSRESTAACLWWLLISVH